MNVLTVGDVMTRPVVVVGTEARIGEIANLLHGHRISGVPVVDADQRLVGVVSQSDLLRRLIRAEIRRVFAGQAPPSASGRPSRATAETAGELMSRPAVSIRAEASVDDSLNLMRHRGVRRLPVVDAERHVVGMVTRTDLLLPYARTDRELREELWDEVLPRLGVDRGHIRLEVEHGNVLLGGSVAEGDLVARVEEAVRDTPGVAFVESRLRARHPPRPHPGP